MLVDNGAADAGGAALRIDTNSSVFIDSCIFTENKRPKGGAVSIKHASSVLINRTSFLNNQGSTDEGGALSLNTDNAVIVINESHIYGNINTKNLKSYYVRPSQVLLWLGWHNIFGGHT